jgi:hypothetical protein
MTTARRLGNASLQAALWAKNQQRDAHGGHESDQQFHSGHPPGKRKQALAGWSRNWLAVGGKRSMIER